MKQTFINKWSCWWTLNRQGKQLTKAFEKELDELINPSGGEITKEELLKRGFNIQGETGDLCVLGKRYIKQSICICSLVEGSKAPRVSIVRESKVNKSLNESVDLPDGITLSQLDALIEMFKTK